jgi:hypothetical protein
MFGFPRSHGAIVCRQEEGWKRVSWTHGWGATLQKGLQRRESRVEADPWTLEWECQMAKPVFYLKFSPDGKFFAAAGKYDRLVKVWWRTEGGVCRRRPAIGPSDKCRVGSCGMALAGSCSGDSAGRERELSLPRPCIPNHGLLSVLRWRPGTHGPAC